jgi:hypothetical protein
VTRAVMELRNTCGEVEALIEAARANRHGHRDAAIDRSGAACVLPRHMTLRWDQVDFDGVPLHVRKVKTKTQARTRCSAMSAGAASTAA